MNAGVLMTFAGVTPVQHHHTTIGAVAEFEPAKPRVSGIKHIFAVPAHVAGAAALQDFLIGTQAVHVESKEMAAVLSGPVVTQVNHHPDVGVTTTVSVRLFAIGHGPSFRCVEMPVVRVLVYKAVNAGIGIDCVGPNEMRARDSVPELAIDGVDEEQFAVLIPIMAPGVGAAAAEHFHDFALGMIAPDRSANG